MEMIKITANIFGILCGAIFFLYPLILKFSGEIAKKALSKSIPEDAKNMISQLMGEEFKEDFSNKLTKFGNDASKDKISLGMQLFGFVVILFNTLALIY